MKKKAYENLCKLACAARVVRMQKRAAKKHDKEEVNPFAYETFDAAEVRKVQRKVRSLKDTYRVLSVGGGALAGAAAGCGLAFSKDKSGSGGGTYLIPAVLIGGAAGGGLGYLLSKAFAPTEVKKS